MIQWLTDNKCKICFWGILSKRHLIFLCIEDVCVVGVFRVPPRLLGGFGPSLFGAVAPPLGPLFDIMIGLINYTSVTVKRHRRWGAHRGGLGGVVSVCIFVFKYSLLSGLLQLKLGSRQSNAAHHRSTSTKTKFLIFQKGTIRRDWVMKWNFVICAGNKYVFNLVGWWRIIVLLL